MGADADTALVEEIAITPANINDGRSRRGVCRQRLSRQSFRRRSAGKGRDPSCVATGMWGRDEAEIRARLEAWNQPIHRIRGRIEKIFGTWKRSYGLRRMRWRGLAKAGVQIRLTAIAYDMKRSLKVIAMAG
ncbi:transposase [Mesorhizobium sp. M0847]|uniref:transposase n=2 Tax=Mesorhizobium TaxID=68287 RepID=UPI00333CD27C